MIWWQGEGTLMKAGQTRTTNWAVEAVSRLRGVRSPLHEEEVRNVLDRLVGEGEDMEDILDHINPPVATTELILLRLRKCRSGRSEAMSDRVLNIETVHLQWGAS